MLAERFGERDLPKIGTWRQLGKTRRQDHRQVRPVIFYFFDQLQSGHVRHGLIGDHQLDATLASKDGERFARGTSFKNLMPDVV
jgi:hypothetical protein